MKHKVHNKCTRIKLDTTAVILIKVFHDILIRMFNENRVRITSLPTDPVWRINFVSRQACGYVLIHCHQDKVSWRIYGTGVDYPKRSIPPKDWRTIVYEIGLWNLFSFDETTRLIANYCLDET
jgi:hypothetical protein